MNELIRQVHAAGYANTIYYLFHVLGFISCFLLLVLLAPKFKIKRSQMILTVLIVFPIVYLMMYVQYWMESGFSSWGGNNIVRVFPYIPLVGLLITWWFKIPSKPLTHLLAYAPLAVHGTAHFGCIFLGCCHGYPFENGLYIPTYNLYTFPIQPIEAIAALAIIVILLIRAKRKNFESDGLEYPIMLILFGSTRFIFEFFRDNQKIRFGCSALSFHALFMCVVGIVALIIIRNRQIKQKAAVPVAAEE